MIGVSSFTTASYPFFATHESGILLPSIKLGNHVRLLYPGNPPAVYPLNVDIDIAIEVVFEKGVNAGMLQDQVLESSSSSPSLEKRLSVRRWQIGRAHV